MTANARVTILSFHCGRCGRSIPTREAWDQHKRQRCERPGWDELNQLRAELAAVAGILCEVITIAATRGIHTIGDSQYRTLRKISKGEL